MKNYPRERVPYETRKYNRQSIYTNTSIGGIFARFVFPSHETSISLPAKAASNNPQNLTNSLA